MPSRATLVLGLTYNAQKTRLLHFLEQLNSSFTAPGIAAAPLGRHQWVLSPTPEAFEKSHFSERSAQHPAPSHQRLCKACADQACVPTLLQSAPGHSDEADHAGIWPAFLGSFAGCKTRLVQAGTIDT